MSKINETIFMKRLRKTMPAKYSIDVKMTKKVGEIKVLIIEENK